MAASATKAEARRRCEKTVDLWANAALFTGWIPGAAFALGAGDAVMIRQIADAYGVAGFDMDQAAAHFGGLLGSVAGGLMSEFMGLVPIIGWAAKSVTLRLKAQGIGKGMIDYFAALSPLPE